MDVGGANIVVPERRVRLAAVRRVLVGLLRERDLVVAAAQMQDRGEVMGLGNDLERFPVAVAAREMKLRTRAARPQGVEARRIEAFGLLRGAAQQPEPRRLAALDNG